MLTQFTYKQKRTLVTVLILGAIFTLVLMIFFNSGNTKQTLLDPESAEFLQEYVDPITGQTVTDPLDKSPEQLLEKDTAPTLLGSAELSAAGITTFQQDSLVYALELFFLSSNYEFHEISVYPNSLNFINTTNEVLLDNVRFTVRAGRVDDLTIDMRIYNLTEIDLTIFDGENTVFESGRVDTYNSANADRVE